MSWHFACLQCHAGEIEVKNMGRVILPSSWRNLLPSSPCCSVCSGAICGHLSSEALGFWQVTCISCEVTRREEHCQEGVVGDITIPTSSSSDECKLSLWSFLGKDSWEKTKSKKIVRRGTVSVCFSLVRKHLLSTYDGSGNLWALQNSAEKTTVSHLCLFLLQSVPSSYFFP